MYVCGGGAGCTQAVLASQCSMFTETKHQFPQKVPSEGLVLIGMTFCPHRPLQNEECLLSVFLLWWLTSFTGLPEQITPNWVVYNNRNLSSAVSTGPCCLWRLPWGILLDLFLASGGRWQPLAFFGLGICLSSFCLIFMRPSSLYLCVSLHLLSSFKDISHWIKGPP